MQTFSNIEDFYNDDPSRRTSPEADYGVHWKLDGWEGSFRVSYVQNTGEVYAVHLGPYRSGALPTGEAFISTGRQDGPVLLLGNFPIDEEVGPHDVYYHGLEHLLDGWPERCGQPNGLAWIVERLEAVEDGDAG